ncbi:hypothetical protein BC835DRAFT_1369719 [Cytidiella melzeri]|nr:hypothetical protein BC835DRAFT_1369719 [Cytidiella melzeri]
MPATTSSSISTLCLCLSQQALSPCHCHFLYFPTYPIPFSSCCAALTYYLRSLHLIATWCNSKVTTSQIISC